MNLQFPRPSLQLYVLADTSYNSLSVDEVAAAHVGAQCVVRFELPSPALAPAVDCDAVTLL